MRTDFLAVIAIVLAVACLASFTWGVVRLFRQPAGMPTAMRWVSGLGLIFSAAQLWALIEGPPPPVAMRLLGLAAYAGALLLFWWAVPYARRAALGIAFAGAVGPVLLTTGPYRWVRHPFYAAYLLCWLAGPLASGYLWLLCAVVIMGAFYLAAIRGEEAAWQASTQAGEYADYARRTGMLVPRFWSRAAA